MKLLAETTLLNIGITAIDHFSAPKHALYNRVLDLTILSVSHIRQYHQGKKDTKLSINLLSSREGLIYGDNVIFNFQVMPHKGESCMSISQY